MDTIHNKKIIEGPHPKVVVEEKLLCNSAAQKLLLHNKVQRRKPLCIGLLPHGFFTYSSRRCWWPDHLTMVRTAADFAALNRSSRYFVHTRHYIEFHYRELVEVDKGHKHQAGELGAGLAADPYLKRGQTQKQCGRYRSPITGYPVRRRMKH